MTNIMNFISDSREFINFKIEKFEFIYFKISPFGNLKGHFSNFRTIYSCLGNYLGFFKSIENNIAFDSTNNYEATSKYCEQKLEQPRKLVWWRRWLVSIAFLVTGIYCAYNGINHLLMGNILRGWIFLFTGFLLGQFASFAIAYGLFINWL